MVAKPFVENLVGKKLHVMGNYHIWQEGGVNRGREKKGEWMSVFPVPPPPWIMFEFFLNKPSFQTAAVAGVTQTRRIQI
jgi:hypothetical protein